MHCLQRLELRNAAAPRRIIVIAVTSCNDVMFLEEPMEDDLGSLKIEAERGRREGTAFWNKVNK